MHSNEIALRHHRLRGYLADKGLDGVLLQTRPNFAWITGGRDNHIVSASEIGVAAILATTDRLICLTNYIEAPRFRTEELAGLDIEIIEYPWWDEQAARKTVAEVIGGRKIASDTGAFGLPALPPGFTRLRWSLTDTEILHYRYCGQLASAAIEATCRQIQVGDSEFDIAARLQFELQRTGANPYVTLVATDRRVFEYRHPIPTARRLERYAMLVVCASYRGLIANCTRFVHFGRLPEELAQKQQAVCNVDAAVNLATRPGRTLGDIFADLQMAYAENGYPDEWQKHHQGGSTGYLGREVTATPGSTEVVQSNQAFAWNPSIQGTKSEDTFLVTDSGIENLTPASPTWPTVTGRCAAGELVRPAILVR